MNSETLDDIHEENVNLFGGKVISVEDDLVTIHLDAPSLATLDEKTITRLDNEGMSIENYIFADYELLPAPPRGTPEEYQRQVDRIDKHLGIYGVDQPEKVLAEVREECLPGFMEYLSEQHGTEDQERLEDARSNADFLLEVLSDYFGVHYPNQYGENDIREFLLDYIPRKYMAEEADIEHLAKDTVAFMRYLYQSEALRGWRETDLKAIADAARRTPQLATNPDNWGIGRSMLGGMLADGIDPTDRAATQNWITGFNNRSFGERDRLFGGAPRPTSVRIGKKYGRNEKVSVVYPDGMEKKNVKYKLVKGDIETGRCRIIG